MASGYPTDAEIKAKAREVWQHATDKAVELENQRRMSDRVKAVFNPLGPDKPHLGPLIVEGDHEWNQINQSFSWVPGLFGKYTKIQPSDFTPVAANMESARLALSSPFLEGYINNSRLMIDDWTGRTADAFQEFILPLESVRQNQLLVAEKSMRDVLLAARQLYAQARVDAVALANATITTIDTLTLVGGDDLALALGVLAAFSTIGAGVSAPYLPLAASLTVVAGILSGGAAIASASAGDEKPPLEGDTVNEILNSAIMASKVLDSRIDTKERELVELLDGNLATIQNTTTDPRLGPTQKHVSQRDLFVAPAPSHYPSQTGPTEGLTPP